MEDWKQIALLAVLAVLLLLLSRIGRRKGSYTRSAMLMKKYATISRETFDRIPEEDLVEAVVSRVLAKAAAQHRPDPIRVLADLPHGSTVVYSVWAVCKELAAADFAALMHTATKDLVEPAIEALSAIGAPGCSEALAAMHAAHKAGEPTVEAEQAFRLAVQTECPLSLCEAYIQDHADEFIDHNNEEEAS